MTFCSGEQEENSLYQKIDGLVRQVKEKPKDHRLQLRLAECLSDLNDTERAIAEWSAIINFKDNADEWRLHSQLANVFIEWDANESEEVDPDLQKEATLHRLNIEIETWKLLVINKPKVWGLQVQLARAFVKKGNIDDEIRGWTDLVRKYPEDWKLQSELAQAFISKNNNSRPAEGLNNLNNEIICWKKLIDQHPDNWELQLRLGEAHSKAASFEEAALVLSRMLGVRRGENAIIH